MFAVVEQRVAHLEGRAMEQSNVFDGIRQTMAELKVDLREGLKEQAAATRAVDDKVSRYFMWMVGIQVTSLIAILGMISAVLAQVLKTH